MESLCTSVNESEEVEKFEYVFDSALLMVQTCTKNLVSDQVMDLKAEMAQIF